MFFRQSLAASYVLLLFRNVNGEIIDPGGGWNDAAYAYSQGTLDDSYGKVAGVSDGYTQVDAEAPMTLYSDTSGIFYEDATAGSGMKSDAYYCNGHYVNGDDALAGSQCVDLRRFKICHNKECISASTRGDFEGKLDGICDLFGSTAEMPYCNRCPGDVGDHIPSQTSIDSLFAMASLETVNPSESDEIQKRDLLAGARWPHRIALLFFTRSGSLVLEEVWTRWMAAAVRWSRQKYASGHPPFEKNSNGALLETSDPFLLSVYLHSADPTANIGLLSSRLRQRLGMEVIEVPKTAGSWGNLNEIQHRLLATAVTDLRNAAFILISDTTVPVAPFSHIYRNFFSNPRSRFAFSKIGLPLFYRKHSQWIVLNRRHAVALSRNPSLWVCHQWAYNPSENSRRKKGVAAPDEFLPYYALQRIFGLTSIQAEINNGRIFRLNENISDVSFFNSDWVEDEFNHTFVDWDGIYGKRLLNKRPAWYYNIDGQFLQRLVDANQIWFFRKVLTNCTVSYKNSNEKESMENVLDRLLIDID